ncbi:MAG: class I SAM-dependent methyltransferase family protein [Candidatus Micrarchaeota archaeon]
MLALKVPFADAENAKRLLAAKKLYANEYAIAKDEAHIYFPLSGKAKFPRGWQIVGHHMQKREFPGGLKDAALKEKMLTKKEAESLIGAYDSMGDIAVVEIPEELEGKERQIGALLLKLHPNFKVVAKKMSAIRGRYRVRNLKVIAGEKRLATTCRESGCRFGIDLGKVYFSPRQGYERERIAKLVKRNEKVLALFAGAGFYPVIIGKFQPKCRVVGIELNPAAVKYMRENVELNKMGGQIGVIKGDAKKILKLTKFKRWASRVIMPLPHSAHEFLDEVLFAAAKGCVVHFYHIPKGECADALADGQEKVRAACIRNRRKFKMVFQRVVKTYAPHVDEVVVDFKLTN